jgi:transposase-like protein
MTAASPAATCPKCRAGMIHVAVTPHPIAAGMQRSTFVCYACNQTRTYMLPAEPDAAAK